MSGLETKIAAWRRELTAGLGGREDLAAELEAHLRDTIDALTATGVTPDDAFAQARARVGDARALAGEFERLAEPWWRGAHARTARALAYASGVFGVAAFVFYLGVSVWGFGRLLDGRSLPADPRWAGFWQMLAAALVVASALAVRASGRFLTRPNGRDLRGVIAFNVLALWMLAVGTADWLRIVYAAKVAVVLGLLGAGVAVWRKIVTTGWDRPAAGP